MYVYYRIDPATVLLMGRNGGVDKLHTQHAILNRRKQVGQRVGLNTIPASENGVGNIGIDISEGL